MKGVTLAFARRIDKLLVARQSAGQEPQGYVETFVDGGYAQV